MPDTRYVTDHIIGGDLIANQLSISVADSPGAGGANHLYRIAGFDASVNSSNPLNGHSFTESWILFQNGPIKENGVNGVTQEALLSIVVDRLRSFQCVPFSCRENAIALTHCEDALMWLQRRTRARIARGVEGTNQK